MKKILDKSYRKRLIPICLIFLVALNCMGFSLLLNKFVVVNDSFENNNFNDNYLRSQGIVKDFYSKEWLTNGNFTDTTNPWDNVTSGDLTDINATSSPDAANFELIGEVFEREVILDTAHQGDWEAFNKSELTIEPNGGYGVDDDGAYCSHDWNEDSGGQPYNTPRMHWKTVVNMSHDMTDYEITNISFRAVINATVNWDVDTPGDSDARWNTPSNYSLNQHVIYDYAQFEVEVSDLDISVLNSHRIAFNQTSDLGNEGPPSNYKMEKDIETYSEEDIIDSLTSVLEKDEGHDNFTLVLMIYMYCEDNYGGNDRDQWEDMRFKYVNLTFTYQKRIDAGSYVQWNQTGNKISGDDVDIENATLNFKYKINESSWPEESPNSEIRVLINDRVHTETVKMSSANDSFQYAKAGGFDVTQLILTNINITAAIRLYIADTFNLNRTINVTIDEVSLIITYYVSTVEIETEYDLFLNGIDKTLPRSTIVTLGDLVNVTLKYTNTSDEFIHNANVSVTYSEGTFDLDYNAGLEYYNITIDTSNFDVGDNFIFITADKKYYEELDITVDIIVREKDAQIDEIYINQTLTNTFHFPYGSFLNITARYEEVSSGNFITGATMKLLNGSQELGEFDENPSYYNFTIDTTILGNESITLIIAADVENFTAAFANIILVIQERGTIIDNVQLNGTERITMSVPYGHLVNITARYEDLETGDYIENSDVKLLNGSDDLYSFDEQQALEFYNLTVNSTDLGIGSNSFTIYAKQSNYSAAFYSINLIIQRHTELQLFLNTTELSEHEIFDLQVNQSINIFVKYRDKYLGDHIDGADVNITGGDIAEEALIENPALEEYNITLYAENFSKGYNSMGVYAQKTDTLPLSISFTINLIERKTDYRIFINESDITSNETFIIQIGETINIILNYTDNQTGEFISGATVEISGGGLSGDLTESGNSYIVTVTASNFSGAINFINIVSEKKNYEYQSIRIRIDVIERQVKYTLYLNGVDKTADPRVEIPIGYILNISFSYLDLTTDGHVGAASIQLIGTDDSWTFTENAGQKLYTLSIDTDDLGIGIRIMSLLAQKTNYQPVSEGITITVRQIRTNITTPSGEFVATIRAGTSYFLQIRLHDLDFNTTILNATVRFSWQGGEGVLTDDDNDGLYEGWINNVPAGTHVITLTISTAEGKYLFESKKYTISSIIPQEEAFLWLLLLIAAIIGFGTLSAYFIYYQRVKRYPLEVRKVRKFKRSLKKDKEPTVEIFTKDYSFNSAYNAELGSAVKFMKPIPIGKVPTTVKAQRALEYREMQKKKALEEKTKKAKPKPPKPEKKPEVEKPKEELRKELKEKVEKKPKAEPKAKPKEQPKAKPKTELKAKPKEKPKKPAEKSTKVKAKAKVKKKEAPEAKESVMDELKEKFKEKAKK